MDATSLVKWRHRVGDVGMERLLQETIATAQRQQLLKRRDIAKVNVDTTVQEKAISFPTDAKLYHTMRVTLVKAARERGVRITTKLSAVEQSEFTQAGSVSACTAAQTGEQRDEEVEKLSGASVAEHSSGSAAPG